MRIAWIAASVIVFCLILSFGFINPLRRYTSQNIHAHNDYAQAAPFWNAYRNRVGSMEADVFISEDRSQLLVAHTATELQNKTSTLEALYLAPLAKCIAENNGYVYADTSLQLQLMIDLKTRAGETLQTLINIIGRFPALTSCNSLKIVISGNRPPADSFVTYPSYIWFDGNLSEKYDSNSLSRIAMLSASFGIVSSWNGQGKILPGDKRKIMTVIKSGHDAGKKVRFWGTPDTPRSWAIFMKLGVDYLNTDRVSDLANRLARLH
jgi:alkaline phosphatase